MGNTSHFYQKNVDRHSWLYPSVEYNSENKNGTNVKYGEFSAAREHYAEIMERAGNFYKNMIELKA